MQSGTQLRLQHHFSLLKDVIVTTTFGVAGLADGIGIQTSESVDLIPQPQKTYKKRQKTPHCYAGVVCR